MYRLSSGDDLFDIGWEDYLVRGGICAVEWSEKVDDAFDDKVIKVRLSRIDDTTRSIAIEDI